MKTLFKTLFSVTLLAWLSLPAYGQQSLLWKVSGKDLKEASYLFGTHHLVPGSFLDKHPKAAKYLRKSKHVVVEVELDSSEMMQLSALMLDPAGGAWVQRLTAEEATLLDSVLQHHMGAGLGQMSVLRPAAVSTLLSLALTQHHTEDLLDDFKGDPIDLKIAKQARKRKKQKLIALESLREQFDILYTQEPIDSQLHTLTQMIHNIDSIGPYTRDLLESYLAQDAARMAALLEQYATEYGGMDILLADRNDRWMQTLPAIFESGSSFVAVGALHLYGAKGLIQQLQQAGYSVEPVRNDRAESSMLESGADIAMWISLIILFTTADAGNKPKQATNLPQHA